MKPGITFDLHCKNKCSHTDDGLQPWCRRCDWIHKNEKQYAFGAFTRRLRDGYEDCVPLWTRKSFEEMMGDWTCWACKGKVWTWSGGYWVDRVDNSLGYIPENCRPCCWPCNEYKGANSPDYLTRHIRSLIDDGHVLGKIPHGTLRLRADGSPKYTHYTKRLPSLSTYEVPLSGSEAYEQAPLPGFEVPSEAA